jgi:fibronectin-binding autotransporter adhesin
MRLAFKNTAGIGLALVLTAGFAAAGSPSASAADFYWDTNGATPLGDGAGRWRQASNVAIWSTSPLGDVPTVAVGGSAAIGSVQFGFGPASENPGSGGQIEVSNNTAGSQDPNVSGIIFNASGAAPYTIVNRAQNPAALITLGVGGLDMPEGVGILVNDNVVGNTLFRVNSASASPATNDFRIALSADQIWRNTSPTYALDVGIKVTGGFALTTEGPGLITLGGANSFSGGLTVASGILRAAHAEALSSGAVTLASGSTLDVRAAIIRDIAGTGLVTIAPGGSLTAGTMGTNSLALGGEAGNAAGFTTTAAGELGLASVAMGGNATIGLAAGTTIAAVGGVSVTNTGNTLSLSGVAIPGTTYSLLTGASIDASGSIALTGSAVGNQVIPLGSSATVGRTTYAFSNSGTALQLGVTGTQLTLTWTGADTSFWNYNELISNWSDNGTPTFFGVGDNAVVDAATTISVRPAGVAASAVSVTNGSGTVLINGGELAAASLTKTNAGTLELGGAVNIGTLTVSAGTLALADGASVTAASLVNNATLSHAGTAAKTLSTALSGNGVLTQSGTGRLTLGGAGDYAGSMSVATGSVLELGQTALLGPGGVYGGGIDIAGELVAASSTGQNLAGPLTGAGTLTKSGGGVVTISGDNGGFGGLINMAAGTLRLGSSGALGGATPAVLPGGALDLGGQAISGKDIVVQGAGVGATGGFVNSDTATAASWSGQVILGSASTGLGGDGDMAITGVVSGGGLTKYGEGTVTLANANTYTGTLSIQQGTVRVLNQAALPNGDLGWSNSGSSAALDLVAPGNYPMATISSFGSNLRLVTSGTGEVSLTVAGQSSLTGNADKTLQVGENVTAILQGNILAGSANRERSLRFLNAGDVVINGTISGAGTNPFGLVQTSNAGEAVPGNGTLHVNGTNGYTGTTRVSAGTLEVGNSLALGTTAGGTLLNVATENVGTDEEPVIQAIPGVNPGTLDLNGFAVSGEALTLEGTYGRPRMINSNLSTPASWSGGIEVIDAGGIGGPGAIELTGGITGTAGRLAKIGPGTVILSAVNSFLGTIAVEQGTLVVGSGGAVSEGGLTVETGGTLQVATGTTMRSPSVIIDGGTFSAATVAVNSSTGITSLEINAGTIAGAPVVTVGAGGQLSLVQDARVTVGVGGLSVDEGGSGGRIDLGAGQVTVAAGGISAADLRADIIAGRNNGGWNGTTGIMSSAAAASGGTRAVGYGVAPDGSVRVSYAAAGDVDLNGQVNVFDLVSVNSGGRYGTGQAAVWAQGDFNYDGVTNVFDLVGVNTAAVYGKGNYFPAAPTATGGVAAVPEPMTGWLALAGLAALGLATGRHSVTTSRGHQRRQARTSSSQLTGAVNPDRHVNSEWAPGLESP